MKKLSYFHTLAACSLAYVSQAIAATFLPLLFVQFQSEFGLTLEMLSLLITATFFIQIIVDGICPFIISKLGYRKTMIMASVFSAVGFSGLAWLPNVLPNAYLGIILSTVIFAIGAGIDEVLVSPIVEACPTKNKAKSMGIVHSSFSAGCVAVVIISTVFFKLFSIENWRILALLWSVIPFFNIAYFCFVPIRTLEEEKGKGKVSDMFKNPLFWLLGIIMVCAGASELSMSQWASAFAETGLGVSKTVGDLLGPCAFAVLMLGARLLYSNFAVRIGLIRIMAGCCVLCIISYLMASLSENPVVALLGCCLCGISIAPLWPGTFSLAGKYIPNASTAMFAAFALLGDLGCSAGPSAVGIIAQNNGNNISKGLLFSIIFPIILIICLIFVHFITKKKAHR